MIMIFYVFFLKILIFTVLNRYPYVMEPDAKIFKSNQIKLQIEKKCWVTDIP